MSHDFLDSAKKQFAYYKQLGDKTFAQLTNEQLFWQYHPKSNSIGIIVKHLWGNMLSRWTNFLTEDGEKESRDREAEFDSTITTREELLEKWNEGWQCLFNALEPLTDKDLEKVIYIRNMGHTVAEAIKRQLAHYPYHVGQIVLIGTMLAGDQWQSLSIPRGQSAEYNKEKFTHEKHREHFTDEVLNKDQPK
ncbi:DUF1572 domain-containing protein [Mucilaginibacter sp. RS28]|uniref:DUF1572 domain-containing protein n=1 Tax=Mucilaginibacter straminoryzae TaxID=2932774 RepID=A0A9X1X167_9SPHI|nr:DUF1572 family protein [Mucilaginibacter straminoryzae]MCJ8209332.1 DUF1572 domain-containing protein [Mucilaginibacter straminoryzae]